MNIVITGAGKGIGAEIVRFLCKQKGNQIVAISRNGEHLRKLQADCLKLNPDSKVSVIEFDLVQFDFYTFLLQKIGLVFQHCDILINNAGHLINKSFEKFEFHDFDDIFNSNVKSLFFFTQMIIPTMNKGGHVVNIGSIGGIQGTRKFPGLSAYSASKAAVTVLTEALAEELTGKDISVNCLALGAVQTEMFEKAFPGQRALQMPHQIAQYIAEFSINGDKYFNGKVIPVSVTVP
jgi:short-subunit dehydrogenase